MKQDESQEMIGKRVEIHNIGANKASTPLANPVRMVWNPIKNFVLTDNSSGIALFIATVVALAWANLSPESYTGFWETHLSVNVQRFAMDLSIRDWVNDALMTLFFLLVGLEIKRELLVGELSSFSQAILPVIAAAGGMLVPAILYTLVCHGTDVAHGWGIPVATDIAFALGALTLVGKRVPASAKVFLVALAIADDLGAVLVIALFYGGSMNFAPIAAAFAIFFMLLFSNRLGIRSLVWYLSWGFLLWLAVCFSGVHSTIAGVMLAMTIPAWSRTDVNRFSKTLKTVHDFLVSRPEPEQGVISDKRMLASVEHVNRASMRILPSLSILEHALGNWVSLIIMPLFALANAGVAINNVGMQFFHSPLTYGIALGLICGKAIGIVSGTYLTIKLGFASLPRLCTWRHLWGVGMLGGVGFTMALFVAGLAVNDAQHLDNARLAILSSSAIAGMLGIMWLKMIPPVVDTEIPSEDIDKQAFDKMLQESE